MELLTLQFPIGEESLGQQFLNHVAADLAELFVAPFVEVGEFVVVEAQQMQDRAVQVFDVMDRVDCLTAKLIGGADRVAGVDAASG